MKGKSVNEESILIECNSSSNKLRLDSTFSTRDVLGNISDEGMVVEGALESPSFIPAPHFFIMT